VRNVSGYWDVSVLRCGSGVKVNDYLFLRELTAGDSLSLEKV
jgi:hypothetical protein